MTSAWCTKHVVIGQRLGGRLESSFCKCLTKLLVTLKAIEFHCLADEISDPIAIGIDQRDISIGLGLRADVSQILIALYRFFPFCPVFFGQVLAESSPKRTIEELFLFTQ